MYVQILRLSQIMKFQSPGIVFDFLLLPPLRLAWPLHLMGAVYTAGYLNGGSNTFRVLGWNPIPAIFSPAFLVISCVYLLSYLIIYLQEERWVENHRGHVWIQASVLQALLTWVSYPNLTSLGFDFPCDGSKVTPMFEDSSVIWGSD